MKRDNLEKFILENREALDRETPSLDVWANIDQELSRQGAPRVVRLWSVLRVAAAVALLLLTGGIIGSYLSQAPAADPAMALEQVAPEYLEMASYFEGQVDSRVAQLAAYRQQDTVLEDMDQLDRYMQELKEELINAPKGKEEEIIENLIRGYQTKIEILERVLDRLQSTNQGSETPSNDEITL